MDECGSRKPTAAVSAQSYWMQARDSPSSVSQKSTAQVSIPPRWAMLGEALRPVTAPCDLKEKWHASTPVQQNSSTLPAVLQTVDHFLEGKETECSCQEGISPCKREGEYTYKKNSGYICLLFILPGLRGTWQKAERDQVQRALLLKDTLCGIISESQPILANSRCLFAKQKFAMLNCHYNATLKRRYHHSCDDTRQPWTETEAGAHTSEQQTTLVPWISNPAFVLPLIAAPILRTGIPAATLTPLCGLRP